MNKGLSSLIHIKNRLIELGRPDVRIIAVSKTHPPESISKLLNEGQIDFGENRYAEARDKIPLIDVSGLSKDQYPIFHHIGPLQSGNARQIPSLFHYIHGVSSFKTLLIMGESALKIYEKVHKIDDRLPIKYLIQVNLTGEDAKSGMTEKELLSMDRFYENEAVKFCGFMTMGPANQDPVFTREVFHHLRELRDRILPEGELSMGMSGDWEIAVSEGATMIRLGTILFGERKGGPWKKS
ncbi:MAG: YggS family pyridoxal phosphate-dependent enzyme, partial [Spirochaetia bacterium]|nr:YggS family pyridoxal phosphate-dependent enzyme [Spirochaetia bacterium]